MLFLLILYSFAINLAYAEISPVAYACHAPVIFVRPHTKDNLPQATATRVREFVFAMHKGYTQLANKKLENFELWEAARSLSSVFFDPKSILYPTLGKKFGKELKELTQKHPDIIDLTSTAITVFMSRNIAAMTPKLLDTRLSIDNISHRLWTQNRIVYIVDITLHQSNGDLRKGTFTLLGTPDQNKPESLRLYLRDFSMENIAVLTSLKNNTASLHEQSNNLFELLRHMIKASCALEPYLPDDIKEKINTLKKIINYDPNEVCE